MPVPVPVRPAEVPTAVRPVWERIAPMGAVRIEPHEDSGGWVAVFPYQLTGFVTAGDLSRRMFEVCTGVAESTPFGSGRWQRPDDAWYVTFRLVPSGSD